MLGYWSDAQVSSSRFPIDLLYTRPTTTAKRGVSVILLNPKKYSREHADRETREIILKTIGFFENKGLKRIKKDDQEMIWYDDFLEFIKREQVFAKLFF